MSLYDRIRNLPLHVTDMELAELQLEVSSSFRRLTTEVVLLGPDASEGLHRGRGEDVSYGSRDQELFREHGPSLRDGVVGRGTLADFSDRLDALELFAEDPEQDAYRDYRRWAFESAAMDLALRQSGIGLAQAFGRQPSPLRFVVSMRLPEPPRVESLDVVRSRYPGTRFKLDLEASWTREFLTELEATKVVDIVDLKGMYSGTIVDLEPDPQAYAAVVEAMPRVWIEDPRLQASTVAVFEGAWDRVTWDAPMHSVADVLELDREPRMLNCKPSRFGTWRRLLDFYDYCSQRDIGLYAGGQFELGVGRDQIQCLAALFHPDAPNDCAPRGYNAPALPSDLPESPWQLPIASTGFGFAPSEVSGDS